MTITAIETTYAGCRFRSRLEARWAVFFDHLDIPWRYEPEGFKLPSGAWYLPDFWLPEQQLWYEVKGVEPPEDDPWFEFAGELREHEHRAVMAWGDIPDPRTVARWGPPTHNRSYPKDVGHDIRIWGDYDYAWCRCPSCGSYDVQFEARSARNYCSCRHNTGHPDKKRNGNDPTILAAYAAARSARFEHAEREVWV